MRLVPPLPRIFWLCCAWLAGIYVGSQAPDLPAWLLVPALAAPLGALWRFRRLALYASMAGLALAGALHYQAYTQALRADPLATVRDAGPVGVRGVVAEPPEVVDVTARWPLDVTEMRSAEGWMPASGRVLVQHRWLAAPRYGDRLELTGKLQTPRSQEGFDYREYLLRQGVLGVMRYPRSTILDHDHGNPLHAALLDLRDRLQDAIERVVPEPEGALIVGILLGLRSGIPQPVFDEFRRTATTHILVVSGSNLVVVAGLLAGAGGRFLGRRHWAYVLLMLAGVWGYGVLVGLSPSVLRAAIMASLVLLAGLLGRQNAAVLSLALAASIMAALNPMVLHDLGFQLSFMAMAGVTLGPPLAHGWLRRSSSDGGAGSLLVSLVAEPAAATLGAALFTLPVQAINFGTVPLAALPATLFALPALPPIMAGGLAAALTESIAPWLGAAAGALAWIPSSYLLAVVHWWAGVPLASVPVPALPGIAGACYLALLLAALRGLWWWQRSLPPVTPRRALPGPRSHGPMLRIAAIASPAAGAGLLIAAGVVTAFLFTGSHGDLTARFLDLSGGEALLIETPGGRRVLVDGGPSRTRLLNALGASLPPWDRSIDLAILTDPRPDHITGLIAVVDRYQVGAVLEGETQGSGVEYGEWEKLLENRAIPRVRALDGTRIRVGELEIQCIHPVAAGSSASYPLALRLTAYGTAVLLPGSSGVAAALALLERTEGLESTVLHLPASDDAARVWPLLLAAAVPRAAVTAAQPSPDAMDAAGLTLLSTELDGVVELRIGPEGAVLHGSRPRRGPSDSARTTSP